ncbi:hypothetical protein [Infirmifilum sp.]|uniref:hypothetical protein n=1 Tax=Infirmifilum sp. TaxID=2856575 RepID=UPI003D0A0221
MGTPSPIKIKSGKSAAVYGMYTAVVYRKPRRSTVVLYINGSTFTFRVNSGALRFGRVRRAWVAGGKVEALSLRVKANELAPLLRGRPEACRKMYLLDVLFREAAKQGYRVHDNQYFVDLWLSKPLGHPLGISKAQGGTIDESALGDCIKCFSRSFDEWRIVVPPWCCEC